MSSSAGTPVPPYTLYDGQYGTVLAEVKYQSFVDYYLPIYQTEKRRAGHHTWSIDIDFTGISSLKIFTQRYFGGSGAYLYIRLDGATIFSDTSTGHSWTERTLDVSAYSGVKSLQLSMYGSLNSTSTAYNCNCNFAKITLVRS